MAKAYIKRPEKEEKYVELLVPNAACCPFRYEGKCTLIIEEEIIKNCSLDFQRPSDCPLDSTDVLVKADDKTGNDNSETSQTIGQVD